MQHYDAFLELCKKKLLQFYGNDVQKASDFARIVSTMHCQRLKVRSIAYCIGVCIECIGTGDHTYLLKCQCNIQS